MRTFYLIFLFILFTKISNAQAIVWKDNNKQINIGKQIDYLEDKTGTLTYEQVSSDAYKSKFVPSKKNILNFGFTESYYWLHFTFKNTSKEKLLFEIAHAFLPITELYYRDTTGKVKKMKAGYQVPFVDKIVKSHFQTFPLPKGKHEFYVRLVSNSHPLSLSISEQSVYEIDSLWLKIGYGFYLGFMSFVILSNLFFFFSLRNGMYLFNSFIVLLYTLYAALVMDGFILYIVPKLDMMFWYVTIPTIGVIFQTMYCLLFLELKRYAPKLEKVVWGIVGYFAIYAIVKFFLPLTIVLAWNTVHAMISFFIMGFVGFKVGRNGNKMGYFYASAYMIYFCLVVVEAIHIQTGEPEYFMGLSHVTWATLIESFILSFLLSKRFEWDKAEIEKEKEIAQTEVLKRVKENQKILAEQNAVLEVEVSNRTEEIRAQMEEIETQKEVLHERNLLLNTQNEEITQHRNEIEKQNKDITSSIRSAQRIQTAILTTDEHIQRFFEDYFVLFKPRDIVSGDFYWFRNFGDFFAFVAADCTGHGVPGAFMSMLGVSFLNEIVTPKTIKTPNLILAELRRYIKTTMNQIKQRGESQDGMDISFCSINMKNNILHFAGAYNPVWIVRKDNPEIIELKGDRRPVGVHPKDQDPFTHQEFQLLEGDLVYTFSDGYASQFGGENNDKFKNKRLKDLLLNIQNEPMEKQKYILEQTLANWQGQRKQVDDILLIGIKITPKLGYLQMS